MLNQTLIADTSYLAKFYLDELLTSLNNQTANGEDTVLCRNQFILLSMWVDIMDRYLIEHYDNAGNITPDFDCLTQTQILELVAKVKVMLGSFTHNSDSDWILANGTWVDSNFWRDSAFWIDSPII